jgi:hypothetical protein
MAALAAVPVLEAQQSTRGERPANWRWRFDRPAADSLLAFTTMAPGWHITTGPAVILYDPDLTASGNFRLESRIVLFPPGEHAEAFGLLLGGRDLQGPGQSYIYFVIRKDGRFLVKRREASGTRDLIAWTSHAAITPHPGGEGTVTNVLAVDAGESEVRFLVNGQQVASLPRATTPVDGVVGFRINHRLNLHVTTLTLNGRNVAPEPARPAR